MSELPEFLNARLVASLIGDRINGGRPVYPGTVDNMVKDGRLPKPQKSAPSGGGKRFWRSVDVLAAIEAWRVS